MMKLSGGKEVHPLLRVIGAKDAEICFYLLIGPFSLSICLRVICSGEFDVVVKELCQFSGKGRSELRASVRYQGVMKTKSFEHMVEEECGYSCCIYGF